MIEVYSSESNYPLPYGAEVGSAEIAYCQQENIPTYSLMERAGRCLWNFIDSKISKMNNILVIVGPGNNGGDGFEVALHVFNAGKNVSLRFVSKEKDTQQYIKSMSGDAAIAIEKVQQVSIPILPLEQQDFVGTELIVDALLGTGICAPAREEFSVAIHQINQSAATVLSVDVPSGLNSDTATEIGVAVRANYTLTFIGIKPGLVTAVGKECCGKLFLDRLSVKNIDSFMKQDRLLTTLFYKSNKSDARKINSHKGEFGRTLIIGGNLGMGGAAMLSAAAACRAGSGAVMMITRPQHVAATLAQTPEVMVVGTDSGVDSEAGELALKALNSATAIVLGPGLGHDAWAEFWLKKALLTTVKKVVDADGLRLAKQLNLSLENTIITPHPGEAVVLLEGNSEACFSTAPGIQQDRFKALKMLQQQTKATVVLKGAGTLIGGKNRANKTSIRVCPYGNSGMATAGMGDILAGILGALLSQGMEIQRAAVVGTLMHSLAGDRAAASMPIGLMATDLLDEIRIIRNQI